jgi:hypothetical protein
MREEGYNIPDKLPCVEIIANSREEAKVFLLQYISQHGKVDPDGLYEYLHTAGLSEELETLNLELDLPGIDFDEFTDGYFNDTLNEEESVDPVSPEWQFEYIDKMCSVIATHKSGEQKTVCTVLKGPFDQNKIGDLIAYILGRQKGL